MSVPLQICNGTDISGIILAHIPCLMGADFCVWCGICAKYLAFSTYPISTVGALIIIIIIRRRRRITEILKLKYEKRNREGERV